MATNTEVSTAVEAMLIETSLLPMGNFSLDCDSNETKTKPEFKTPSPNWRSIRKKSLRNKPKFSLEHVERSRSDSEDLASEDSGCDFYKIDSPFNSPSSDLRTIKKKKSRLSGLSQQYLDQLQQYVEERSQQLQSRMKVMHMPMARRCNKFGYSPDVTGKITDY